MEKKKETWIMADIHGYYSALVKMLEITPNSSYLFLGDYIDRGPESNKVLDKLLSLDDCICLLGNHEQMCLLHHNMHPSARCCDWIYSNGGNSTLKSFGLSEYERLEEKYLTFFQRMPLHHLDTINGVNILAHHSFFKDDDAIEEELQLKNYRDYIVRYNKLATNEENGFVLNTFLNDVDRSFLWNRDYQYYGSKIPKRDFIEIHGHTPVLNYYRYYHLSRNLCSEDIYRLFENQQERKNHIFIYGPNLKVMDEGNDIIVDVLKDGFIHSINIDGGCAAKSDLTAINIIDKSLIAYKMIDVKDLSVKEGFIRINYHKDL